MKKIIYSLTIAIVSVILIAGCKKDDFKEITRACPFVESTSPENAALGVSLNQGISITFNDNMNPASCSTEAPFTLEGPTSIAGSVSYNGTTMTFKPIENLSSGTTYTANYFYKS